MTILCKYSRDTATLDYQLVVVVNGRHGVGLRQRVTTTWQTFFNNLSTKHRSCETYKCSPKLKLSRPLLPICYLLYIALSGDIMCVDLI